MKMRCTICIAFCQSLGLTFAASCLPSPISVPVGNASLSSGGTIRGAVMGIGSPPQIMAFDVYLYVGSDCSQTTSEDLNEQQCISQHGGHFDPSKSTTLNKRADIIAAGASPADRPQVDNTSMYSWAVDKFTFTSNTSSHSIPFAMHTEALDPVQEPNPYPLGVLGLGQNSSMLNSLRAQNMIGSNVFSYYWGLTGENSVNQANGSLILGGIDAAKIAGQPSFNFSIPSTPGVCGQGIPLVGIQQLYVVHPNANKDPILGGSRASALTACFDPSGSAMINLPTDPVYYNFEQATGMWVDPDSRSLKLNWFDISITNTSTPIFPGDLEISFDNGLSVTVPNDQLIQPDWGVDSSGNLYENTTSPVLLMYPLQSINENDTAALGRNFLSSAYLMVNQKQGTITLWPAVRTSKTQILAVDDDGNMHSDFCTSAASNSTSSPDDNDSGQASSSVSGGTIAGAVVGSLAGVGLISAAIFFLLRRRRARKHGNISVIQSSGTEGQKTTYGSFFSGTGRGDGGTDKPYRGELNGEGNSSNITGNVAAAHAQPAVAELAPGPHDQAGYHSMPQTVEPQELAAEYSQRG